jgi:hypothetical protein
MLARRVRRAAVLTASAATLLVPAVACAAASASVTVSLTKPVNRTVTRPTPVLCSVTGSTYRAVARMAVGNYRVSVSDVVHGYGGSGSYPSTARLTVLYVPTGVIRTAIRHPEVQIDGAAETGTAPFSVTFSGTRAPRLAGLTVAGTVSWKCGS